MLQEILCQPCTGQMLRQIVLEFVLALDGRLELRGCFEPKPPLEELVMRFSSSSVALSLLYRLPEIGAARLEHGDESLRVELNELGLRLELRGNDPQGLASRLPLLKAILAHHRRRYEAGLPPEPDSPELALMSA